MTLTGADWRALRGPLFLFGAAVAIAIALVSYSGNLRRQAQMQMQQQQSLLQEARARYTRSDEEKRIIERYLGPFQALESAGFVGTESRIRWIDALRTVGQQLKLNAVEYQISAQRDALLNIDAGAFKLRESPMRVSFDAMHEGDLLAFLDALRAQHAGIFLVESCDLKRAGIAATVSSRPTLKAQCDLSWLTLIPPAAR